MIEVSGISKKYGKKIVLQDINFRAYSGENVVIVGKNGCGKTTLMQVLAGIVVPDEGSISYFGQNPQKKQKYFRHCCGYVPQGNPLMEELTVQDNLKLWGVNRCGQYEQILDSFQLRELLKTETGKLSGGMKRRLAISCALAGNPKVLLLDEPTTALDLYYKQSIEEWLKDYKGRNGIVVMTTHEECEILNADRCFVMHDGILTELPKTDICMEKIKEYIQK